MGVLHAHKDVLNNGLSELLNNVNQVMVIKAYAADDAYATVTAGANVVASEAIAGGDKSLQDHGAFERKWQCNGKAGITALIDTANTDDLHIAYVDTVNSKVLFVTDEITDQEITTGNPVDIPAGEYRSLMPTAV